MTREDRQMKIRIPADLMDQVEEATRKSRRSINAEVLLRLELTFNAEKVSDPNALSALLRNNKLADEFLQKMPAPHPTESRMYMDEETLKASVIRAATEAAEQVLARAGIIAAEPASAAPEAVGESPSTPPARRPGRPAKRP